MKSISSIHYTKEYYLSNCAGYETFKKTKGQVLDRRFKSIVSKIHIKKGMKVLDIGCGRGEIVFWAVRKGCQACGVDYSKDAILLANQGKKALPKGLQTKCLFENKYISQMNYESQKFDVITLVEVVEHLYPSEQLLLFKKIKSWLKKDGILFVHTEPNKLFNECAYKYYSYPIGTFLVSLSNLLTDHKYPSLTKPNQIRSAFQKMLHISEPTYLNLKELFKKTGFKGKILSSGISVIKPVYSWKDIFFNFLVYLYPFSNFYPLNILFGNDFYSILTKQ